MSAVAWSSVDISVAPRGPRSTLWVVVGSTTASPTREGDFPDSAFGPGTGCERRPR